MLARGSLVGLRFGRYFVIEEAETLRRSNQTEPRSLCRCDCGTIKIVRNAHLRSGKVVSCGCHSQERATKHGQAHPKSREYSQWASMVARCTNPNNPKFADYGGRGITVCKSWMDSFVCFYRDMGQCPPKLTIERIGNNKGYSAENCKWDTRKNQQRNTRRNLVFTVHGVTACLAELCEMFTVDYRLTYSRLYYLGWPIERALFETKH